jgi:hypothetical protein
MDKRVQKISRDVFVVLTSRHLGYWTPEGEPTDWAAVAQIAVIAAKALVKEWDLETFGEGGDPSYYFPTNDFVPTLEDFEDNEDDDDD